MSRKTKQLKRMYQAKEAIATFARYSIQATEPTELEALIALLLEQVYRHADKKNPDTLKGVLAFSNLLADLNSRAVKVSYGTSEGQVSKEKRNKLIIALHKRGKSFQEISDTLAERNIQITKSGVYKVVQKEGQK